MTRLYRVEARDHKGWSLGVRVDPSDGKPRLCDLAYADHFEAHADAALLLKRIAATYCGKLRVHRFRG